MMGSAYGDPASVVEAAMRGPMRRPHEYTLPQLMHGSSFLQTNQTQPVRHQPRCSCVRVRRSRRR